MQSLENIEAELECRLYGVCSADEVKMLLPEIAENLEIVGGQFKEFLSKSSFTLASIWEQHRSML